MSRTDKALSPLMGVLKPLAKKYITRENVDQVFDALTAEAALEEGEKAVIVIHRLAGGTVAAGVYATAGHTLTRQYSVMAVEELILDFLK